MNAHANLFRLRFESSLAELPVGLTVWFGEKKNALVFWGGLGKGSFGAENGGFLPENEAFVEVLGCL